MGIMEMGPRVGSCPGFFDFVCCFFIGRFNGGWIIGVRLFIVLWLGRKIELMSIKSDICFVR